MITPFLRKLTLLFSITCLTTSCGGDSGDDSVAGGGISGTGVSSGAISGFGSIFVNGVEFETVGAAITINGIPASETDLKKGMVVTVQGLISGESGAAITVEADDVVKGLVDSVAADGLSLVVLGQTVLVDNNTVIDNNIPGQDIRNLNPGVDLVEVHGFVKDDGRIGATFIERKAALAEFRVKGFVASTNVAAQTFTIGVLTIDYSAADIGDLPGGNPVNDQLVAVKGQNALGPSGELLATQVEPEGLGVADAPQAEIEGFVTAMTSSADFTLGSQRVITTTSTLFAGGLPGDIALGVKLEVEGTLAAGILTAEEISFRDSIKLESDVATLGASSFTLKGLGGISVTVNRQTEFKGSASTFGDIALGDHVQVRGRLTGTTVTATEVDEDSAKADVILQGPVDATPVPTDPTFSILGVPVNTTGIPDANFEGVDDAPIGRADFFGAIAPTDLVKAQGTLAGATVTWDEVELED
ncbi:MAG: DUF5666 domain-containing protein [Acidiferrobacterales bacterium]